MEINQIIEVTVARVESGYIKVDYKGLSATLQITELTWRPGKLASSDYVRVGQKVRVKVIAMAGDQFSVSLRQASLGGDPWENPPKIGDRYFAPVVGVTDYGYFFEITYYCHALLLVENAPRVYQLGDRVNVEVSSVKLSPNRVTVILVNEPQQCHAD